LAGDEDDLLTISIAAAGALEQEAVRNGLRGWNRERHRPANDVADGALVVIVKCNRLAGLFTQGCRGFNNLGGSATRATRLLRVGKRERHSRTATHKRRNGAHLRCEIYHRRDSGVRGVYVHKWNGPPSNGHRAARRKGEKPGTAVRARVEIRAGNRGVCLATEDGCPHAVRQQNGGRADALYT